MVLMGESTFNQMTQIVPTIILVLSKLSQAQAHLQLVQVSEVRKALLGCHNGKMYIQVSVRLGSPPDHVRQFLDSLVQHGVFVCVQRVTSSLDPFPNIRVPEQMVWDRPVVWLIIVWDMLQLEGVISSSFLHDVQLERECGALYHTTPW